MTFLRNFALFAGASLVASLPAAASHMVTGNGFGFAVVLPEIGTVSKFYAHPYCFTQHDPENPLNEGIENANFIQELTWSSGGAQTASTEYEEDSQVIHVHSSDGEGTVFMPFGLQHAALVIDWESGSEKAQGGWHVEWNRPVKSQKTVRLFGREFVRLKFEGIPESLLLIPLDHQQAMPEQPGQDLAGGRAWALVSLEDDDEMEATIREFNRWRAGLSPRDLAKREIAEIEHWRVKPTVHFTDEKERHLWRQSEVLLRMAQSREPNRPGRYNNGLIVAALPDGLWFTPWVRDMAYATLALARMGHRDEARAALLAYFNAQPTGVMRAETRDADYQVSVVRYFGDGSEEPFFTGEGVPNIEFDDWGLVLSVLGEYEKQYHDSSLLSVPTYRGRLYESARDFVVKPLLANLDPIGQGSIVSADTSIWEEHQKDKKHFAFSTAMAIVGLKNFAEVAHNEDDEATRTNVLNQVALLEQGFNTAFIRGGKLRGTMEAEEKNDIDGALLPIINLGLVKDSGVVRDTIERMELLKVASGGYRRVQSNYTDPAIFEYWYERQEFLFVDFNLAEVYRRLGRNADADAILKRIVLKAAADHNLIPEMYVALPCQLFPGELGDPTGALPIVGYGSGAYILHILQREELKRDH
ncbi:MAG: glycoside hydrolase family 15 protein [Terracidiphilus sp.]